MTKKPTKPDGRPNLHYDSILGDISNVIDAARQSTARSVNCIMTAAYWLIGRRIVEFEQKGKRRAEYGEALIEKLAGDLSAFYGKGFSIRNVWQMKAFYADRLCCPATKRAYHATRLAAAGLARPARAGAGL